MKFRILDIFPFKGLTIMPIILINKIKNIFDDIKNDIEIDKNIDIENNSFNPDKYKFYDELFDIIQTKIINSFNSSYFWALVMNEKICDYKYKSGKNAGTICGKRIEIECYNKNGYYRCAKHISTKIYESSSKKHIETKYLCVENSKHGTRCKFSRKYGDYCIYHYKKINNIDNIKDVNKIYEERNAYNEYKIYLEKVNSNYDYYDMIIKKSIININKENNKIDINEYIKYMLKQTIPEDILYNNILKHNINKNDSNVLESLDNIINEMKFKNNMLFEKTRKVLEIKNIESKNIDLDNFIYKSNEFIKNKYINLNDFKSKIDEVSFIPIKLYKNTLINYNNKFREFKKEIKDDFPNIYYNKLYGYFDIMEDTFNKDLIRKLNKAELESIIIPN